VLSFLVSMSMEEQKQLRWALKQLRRHRQKTPSFDQFTAKSPLHPAYQTAKSPLHPAYQSAKSPIHPAYISNAVEGIDLFSSGLQCLPNISLEPQEYSQGKIDSESSNESYSHKAEMLDKNSSTMRSRNDLARGSNRSVVSENTGRSVRRDLWSNKRFDKPNGREMSINYEVAGNNCQDHEVHISQMHHQICNCLTDAPTFCFCLSIIV
jgi:CLIP-associating protein 1/2